MNNKKNILKTLVAFLLISTLGTGLILPIATSAIEITGDEKKIEAFVELMRPMGIKEFVRTGKVAITREGIKKQ